MNKMKKICFLLIVSLFFLVPNNATAKTTVSVSIGGTILLGGLFVGFSVGMYRDYAENKKQKEETLVALFKEDDFNSLRMDAMKNNKRDDMEVNVPLLNLRF